MFLKLLAGTLVGACLIPAAAAAQGGPPPPTSPTGKPVTTVIQGLGTPTSFAFGAGMMFVGVGPAEEKGAPPGGLYVVKDGKATAVKGFPPIVFGVVWRNGTLYVSAYKTLFAASGWDGTSFKSVKPIYQGGKKFDGFNGLAFGPNGRLYAGISLNEKYDAKASPNVFGNSVVSMTAKGKDVKVVSTGLRQPWQMTFMKGNKNPYVTVLANEKKPIAPDWIINAKPGQDYGFPTCNWALPKTCRGFPKPVALLPDHASPMGIQAVGKKLYVALFGGLGTGPQVVSMTPKGKDVKTVLMFAAPVVSLSISNGTLYAGDVTGSVYSVQL